MPSRRDGLRNMDKIIDYIKNNPQLMTAIIITLAVVAVASILGIIIKKYNWLRFLDKFAAKFKSDKTSQKKSETKNEQKPVENKNVITKSTNNTDSQSNDNTEETNDTADEKANTEQSNDTENADTPNDLTQTDERTETNETGDNLDDTPFDNDEYSFQTEQTDENASTQHKSEFSKMILASVASGISEEYEEEKNIHQNQQNQKPEKEETINDIPVETDKKEYEGKWRILRYGAAYCAELHDNSDELLLKSDNYSAIPDVRKAIKALQKNIKANNFNVCVTKNGKFFFKLFSSSGRLIYKSRDFDTRQEVINTINAAKRIAFNAEVVRG